MAEEVRRKPSKPVRCAICGRKMNGRTRYAAKLPFLYSCNLCKPSVELSEEVDSYTELPRWNKVYRLEYNPKYKYEECCLCERCIVYASVDEVLHFYDGEVPSHVGQIPDSIGRGYSELVDFYAVAVNTKVTVSTMILEYEEDIIEE